MTPTPSIRSFVTRYRWAAAALLLLAAAGAAKPIWDASRRPAPSASASAPIEVLYVPPPDAKLVSMAERLKRRAYLEDLRQFLLPLRWPSKLVIAAQQCGIVNTYYDVRASRIVLCYEFVDWTEGLARPSDEVSREDVVMGAITQAALQDVAYALIAMMKIPVLGREQDAADQLAAVLMLEFNADLARRTLPGILLFARLQAEVSAPDISASASQRLYNHLCLLYGADPKEFGFLLDKRLLPQSRSYTCRREYEQMKHAYDTIIRPHVDEAALKKGRTRSWIN